jgi:hypothetical protein
VKKTNLVRLLVENRPVFRPKLGLQQHAGRPRKVRDKDSKAEEYEQPGTVPGC